MSNANKKTKSWHMLNMFKTLESGKCIDVASYAKEYGFTQRSIQRWFEDSSEFKEFFGDKLVYSSGRYCLANNNFIQEHLLAPTTANELERIIDLYYMINPNIFNKFDEQTKSLIDKYYQKTKACYEIRSGSFEVLRNDAVFSSLKTAIKQRRYVDCVYDNGVEQFKFENIKLMKVIFHDGNWYVGCIDNSFELNNGFRWLRLSFIISVSLHPTTFHKDIDALEFIKRFQNMFTLYKAPKYEAIIEVSALKKRFFLSKKHLQSQTLIEDVEGGPAKFRFSITQDIEILPLIKHWIPHIKVLEPLSLKQQIKEDIQNYLNLLN